jgi:hypothetical protein
MLQVECLVVCLVEWAAWVEWVEWECKPKNPIQKFKNAREIKHSGVFFYFFISMSFQCLFNVGCFSIFVLI